MKWKQNTKAANYVVQLQFPIDVEANVIDEIIIEVTNLGGKICLIQRVQHNEG